MTERPPFRRHPDGSIDFDFYRARAATLRQVALREVARERIVPAGTSVMAGALGFAIAVPCTTTGMRDLMAAARTKPFRTR
jgi:hypothetical protein